MTFNGLPTNVIPIASILKSFQYQNQTHRRINKYQLPLALIFNLIDFKAQTFDHLFTTFANHLTMFNLICTTYT
jgi:hypothetical protein